MKDLKILIYGGLLLLLVTSCRKQEFTLPPEGTQVPYTDTVKITLKEALEKSSPKLFYQAWKRSTIEARLKLISNAKSTYTIMVLSDAAMESAGFTSEKIQHMAVKDLDSLMMFYTLPGRITLSDLENKADNYMAASLLPRPDLRVNVVQTITERSNTVMPYYYQYRLQLKGGKTYVNGKAAGNGKFIAAKDGYIWLLEQPVVRPDKLIINMLREDGRFTMLLDILQYTDEQYQQILDDSGIFGGSRGSFIRRYNWDLVPVPSWDTYSANLVRTTALLPTDQVFRNAGFNNLEDLKKFNLKRGLPHITQDQYGNDVVTGDFATDSLLGYHLDMGIRISKSSIQAENSGPSDFDFYTNCMTNAVMSSYIVGLGSRLDNSSVYLFFPMPFNFSNDASGRVQLRLKAVPDGRAVTITEADLPTLMGPVHIVDQFFLPKGFKLN